MAIRWSPGCGCCCSIFEFFSDPEEALQKFRDGVIFSGTTFEGTLDTGESIEVKKKIAGKDLYRLFADLNVPPESGGGDYCFENTDTQLVEVNQTFENAIIQVLGVPFHPPGYTFDLTIDFSYYGVESWIGCELRIPLGGVYQLWNIGDLTDGQNSFTVSGLDAGNSEPNGGWAFYFTSSGTGDVTVTNIDLCLNQIAATVNAPTVLAYPEDTEVFEFDIEVRAASGNGWLLEQRKDSVPTCRGTVTDPTYYQTRYVAKRTLSTATGDPYMERGYTDIGYVEGDAYSLSWYSTAYWYLDDAGDPLRFDFGQAPPYNARVPMAAWEQELGDYEATRGGPYLGYSEMGRGQEMVPLLAPFTHVDENYTVTLTNKGVKFLITELTAEKVMGIDPEDNLTCTVGGSDKKAHTACDPYPPGCEGFGQLKLLHGIGELSAPYASFHEAVDGDRVICSGRITTWCLEDDTDDQSTLTPPDDLLADRQLITTPATYGNIGFGDVDRTWSTGAGDDGTETFAYTKLEDGVRTVFDTGDVTVANLHYDLRWTITRQAGTDNGQVTATLYIWQGGNPFITNEPVYGTTQEYPYISQGQWDLDPPPRFEGEFDDEPPATPIEEVKQINFETYLENPTNYGAPVVIQWAPFTVDLCQAETDGEIVFPQPDSGADFSVAARWRAEGEYQNGTIVDGTQDWLWDDTNDPHTWYPLGPPTNPFRQEWANFIEFESELIAYETIGVRVKFHDRAAQVTP